MQAVDHKQSISYDWHNYTAHIHVLKHQRNGENLYLLSFQNHMARDILKYVNSQLV